MEEVALERPDLATPPDVPGHEMNVLVGHGFIREARARRKTSLNVPELQLVKDRRLARGIEPEHQDALHLGREATLC